MTPADEIRAVLERVEELDREALMGPWYYQESHGRILAGATPDLWDKDIVAHLHTGLHAETTDGNGALMAESRTLLPRLAKAVEILMEHSKGHEENVKGAPENVATFCVRCTMLFPCDTVAALQDMAAALRGEER